MHHEGDDCHSVKRPSLVSEAWCALSTPVGCTRKVAALPNHQGPRYMSPTKCNCARKQGRVGDEYKRQLGNYNGRDLGMV